MGTDSEVEQVVKRALFAYEHDAEFHATVYRAVAVIDAEQRERSGLPLSEGQRNVALLGAMVAVHLRNNGHLYAISQDPTDDRHDEQEG